MPHDDGLPQTGIAQEIGEDAHDCLRANRPRNWQLTELAGVNDFGFDLQVQLSVNQQVTHPFRIQLKGTRSPERSVDGSFISISLSTSTLRFFDNTGEPVLLVLCDLSVQPDEPRECVLYYVWVREELDRIQIASIPIAQKEAVIRVPTANVLNRKTDLIDEVRKQFRLSRAGQELDTSVAGMDPSLASEDRVLMVEAITKNIASRSIVFAQALAEPPTDIWVNPPHGSVAWLLTEAKSALASGHLAKCSEFLRQASECLVAASKLECAEFWYLTGRVHLVKREDDEASNAFKSALAAQPQSKYWAAWAESEMRRRFRVDRSQVFTDVIDMLPADADPVLLSVKARLLAASQKYDQAIALLDTLDGTESHAARAIIETMYSSPERAREACMDGIASEKLGAPSRLLFMILRARAQFKIALKSAHLDESNNFDSEEETIPISGPVGVDVIALREAWADIQDAVCELDEIRWVSNGEFVIDIWIAAAGMLGKLEQTLPRVLAVARLKPHEAEFQSAAETIAAQCGDFQAALEANSRLPKSTTNSLRRVVLLHTLDKHRDCMELMATSIESYSRSHQIFCHALVLAALSADVMARNDRVNEWRNILLLDVNGKAHEATLNYMLTRRQSVLKDDNALSNLINVDEQLAHPLPTTLLLVQELDPGSELHAEYFLAAAARIRSKARLSPLIAAKIGVALTTLRRWSDLLILCEDAGREFDAAGRIRAFQALALDQLGRSDEARVILESMLEGGDEDGLALNIYVNIMVRWGFTEKAKAATQLILERADSKQRRIDCVRALFSLEQQANPSSPHLVDLAFRMGTLVSKNDEVEEGSFLCMVLASTSFGAEELSEDRKREITVRSNRFFEQFPHSKILRRFDIPSDAGAEDILHSLKFAVGLSEEGEQRRMTFEADLKSGKLSIPFAWRPQLALRNVQDVIHLWELTKVSSAEEKHLHLNMVAEKWKQRPAKSLRLKPPLFDFHTLLVLEDLKILDKVFEFFPNVAIAQGTLVDLVNMSQPFAGSIFRQRCIDLQERLRPYIAQILQPQAKPTEFEERVPHSSRELQALAVTGDYVVYSDDFMMRIWLSQGRKNIRQMCTMDLLCGMEEEGFLTTEDVAKKVAQLCNWHVGIYIPLRHLLVLVPEAVRLASSVREAAELLRCSNHFMSIAQALWGAQRDSIACITNIGAALHSLVRDSGISDVTIQAIFSIWLDNANTRGDIPIPTEQLAAQAFVNAAALVELPVEVINRFWNIYLGMIDSEKISLGSEIRNKAISQVAKAAADLDRAVDDKREVPQSEFGERLKKGLEFNSIEWVTFSVAYYRNT